jgi:hypothetical protein
VHQITLAFPIDRSADDVFAFLTDFARLTTWRTLEAVEVDPPGPLRVGSQIRTRVKGPGMTMRFENEVTILDPAGRVYADRALGGTFLIESGWTVTADGAGSVIHWTTRYQPHGAWRLLSPLLGRAIRGGQLKDLRTLKTRLG